MGKHDEQISAANERRKQAADKIVAKAMMKEATDLVDSVQEEVEKAATTAEALIESKGANEESPLTAMENAGKTLEEALSSVEKALDKILKQNMEEIRGSSK